MRHGGLTRTLPCVLVSCSGGHLRANTGLGGAPLLYIEGTFARRVPGIQINVPAIYHNA